ncbi:glycosyltransferase family 4 protein [Candidatus Riflebacteria bacterium]
MKKLIFFISGKEIGGGEKYAIKLAKAIKKYGDYKVFVACPPGGKLAELVVKQLSKRALIPFSFNDIPGPMEVAKFLGRIRKIKPHIIHTHLNRAAIYAGLLKPLLSGKIISTMHGLNRRIYYNMADKIIAVSLFGKEHLLQQGCKKQDVKVIANGVDTDYFQPDKPNHFTRKGRICCVGRLHPNKGQRTLLQAMQILLKNSIDYELHLVGEGPDEKILKKTVVELGISRKVFFHGFLHDVRPVLNRCDIFILPSLNESLPLSALEALSMGLKIIASNVGDLPRILQLPLALMLENTEPECIVKAVKKLSGKKQQSPIPEHRKFVQQNFTWNRVVASHKLLYKKMFSVKRTNRDIS